MEAHIHVSISYQQQPQSLSCCFLIPHASCTFHQPHPAFLYSYVHLLYDVKLRVFCALDDTINSIKQSHQLQPGIPLKAILTLHIAPLQVKFMIKFKLSSIVEFQTHHGYIYTCQYNALSIAGCTNQTKGIYNARSMNRGYAFVLSAFCCCIPYTPFPSCAYACKDPLYLVLVVLLLAIISQRKSIALYPSCHIASC